VPQRDSLKMAAPLILRRWGRSTRDKLDAVRNLHRTPEEVFAFVYARNRWGGSKGEMHSGYGSRGPMGEASARLAARLVARSGARVIVDVGCGDFAVSARMLELLEREHIHVRYIGVDIVGDLIERNRRLFGRDGTIEFLKCNAVTDALPSGDLVILRQICQHLSNPDVEAVLRNTDPYGSAIMQEHHPARHLTRGWNIDKPTGGDVRVLKGSGIRPDLPPFKRGFTLVAEIPDPKGLVAVGETNPGRQEYLAVYFRDRRSQARA
jgi:SAM-dependent methyltransferase